MKNLCRGVKWIIRENGKSLVLVKQNGTLDLPGNRVENGVTIKSVFAAKPPQVDELFNKF